MPSLGSSLPPFDSRAPTQSGLVYNEAASLSKSSPHVPFDRHPDAPQLGQYRVPPSRQQPELLVPSPVEVVAECDKFADSGISGSFSSAGNDEDHIKITND